LRFYLLRLLAMLSLVGAPAASAAPTPRLVIAISVDQFSSEVYARYRENYSAGLKRLSSGIAFPVGYQSHATTETCPGHSTILTGDHPSHTGIIGNSWFDRNSGSTVYCVEVAGNNDPRARGPQKLRVTTLGDWIKQAHPRSRVVAISGKDRAAIMMGGHKPDLVAWWVDGVGFETSQYAGRADDEIQNILERENAGFAKAWSSAPPTLWPAQVPAYCQSLVKPHHFGDIDVNGKVPPTGAVEATAAPGFASRKEFQGAFRASPLSDTLALDFAANMAERWKLGSRRNTDLLAISLSATDYVGHLYGNGGAEMCAQIHALDQSLGAFLHRIDRLSVPYLVVLTADHGAADAPERLKEHGITAERVDGGAVIRALNQHLRHALSLDSDPIIADDAQLLYVSSPGDARLARRISSEAVNWLRQQSSVEAVLTRDAVAAAAPVAGKSPAELTLAERLNESFNPDRSADIFVEFKKYTTFGWPHRQGASVAGHGSPWDYDRQVPILFWWRGAPSKTSSAPVETVDIAPTIANMIGIATPPVDGHCLSRVRICSGKGAPGN